jgi:hypothetical protein
MNQYKKIIKTLKEKRSKQKEKWKKVKGVIMEERNNKEMENK